MIETMNDPTAPEQGLSRSVEAPVLPRTLEQTGLGEQFLLDFLLKSMYVGALQTIPEISHQLKLSTRVTDTLLGTLKTRGLVEIRGASAENLNLLRYALAGKAKARAAELLSQSEYVGAVPVPLEHYHDQVRKQLVKGERVRSVDLEAASSHLILPRKLFARLGPAINSGKAILIYGPPGNGKSSVCEALATVLKCPVYVPYAVEVDGQIIKVFDPSTHQALVPARTAQGPEAWKRGKDRSDPRWVLCQRPMVMAGGELTLKMLDLDFDPISRLYDAPLQMKANNGVLIVDDFGRQLVRPQDLLNRWIVPLERKVDFLSLRTGRKFEVPFDTIVIFSTNLPPADLKDEALLRRVGYKIPIGAPSSEDYCKIFRLVCQQHDLPYSDGLVSDLMENFYAQQDYPLARFHPKFLIDQILAAARYVGRRPDFEPEFLQMAWENLTATGENGEEI